MHPRRMLAPGRLLPLAGLMVIGAGACPSFTAQQEQGPGSTTAIELPGGVTAGTAMKKSGTSVPTPGTGGTPATTVAVGDPAIAGANVDVTVEGGRVRSEVLSLRRGEGSLVTLRVRLVSVAGRINLVGAGFTDGAYYGSNLIDPIGQKRYRMVLDTEHDCICTKYPYEVLDTGESIELYVTFPPIPTSVTHVNVIFGGLPPIEHVAIS